jgi:tmRNA-binding protein
MEKIYILKGEITALEKKEAIEEEKKENRGFLSGFLGGNIRGSVYKKEIKELKQKTEIIGNTVIPLSVYNKDGLIKIEIALVRGKKKFDKRQTIKKREANIEIMRTINKTKFIITLLILSTLPVATYAKVLLKVPYFKQQYTNSCEAAATRMVLEYHGFDFENEDEIINAFGYKPRQKDVVNNIWDDPNEMFVGHIDKKGAENGYGIYGPGVVKGLRNMDMDALYYASSSIDIKTISQSINNKKPVIRCKIDTFAVIDILGAKINKFKNLLVLIGFIQLISL